MSDNKKTPLYEIHRSLGAKIVDFAGFEMPVVYGSIIDEHHAVRERVGLFDVSHMGEFEAEGAGAQAFLQKLLTNNVGKLEEGGVIYGAMCLENGGIVDDLTVYCLGPDRYISPGIGPSYRIDIQFISSQI